MRKLSEIVTIARGTTYSGKLVGEPGPKLLGLGSIHRDGGYKGNAVKTYGGEVPSEIEVREGELYASLKDVTQTADVLGAVARFPKGEGVGRLTQDTVRLDFVSGNGVGPEYLYWMLRTPQYRNYCRAHATGTTTMGLSRRDFLNFQVPAPDANRSAVVELLGALDDKIAANERLVSLNRQLATAVFRNAPRLESTPLSSIASFVNGRAFTKNATGTGRVVIRIAELNSGIGSSTVWNDLEVDRSNLAEPGDLLFAWSGSLTVSRWFEAQAIVNQHIFKVESIDGSPMWLVRELLGEKLDEFKAIAADKATTMGHIKRSHLDGLVPIPGEPWVRTHSSLMAGLWDMELEMELERRTLARTRDELLPLLMSGKITVKDAESVVSEAV